MTVSVDIPREWISKHTHTERNRYIDDSHPDTDEINLALLAPDQQHRNGMTISYWRLSQQSYLVNVTIFMQHTQCTNTRELVMICTANSFTQGQLLCFVYFVCFPVSLAQVTLSVSVQVTDWKDSSPKWPIMCWWGC